MGSPQLPDGSAIPVPGRGLLPSPQRRASSTCGLAQAGARGELHVWSWVRPEREDVPSGPIPGIVSGQRTFSYPPSPKHQIRPLRPHQPNPGGKAASGGIRTVWPVAGCAPALCCRHRWIWVRCVVFSRCGAARQHRKSGPKLSTDRRESQMQSRARSRSRAISDWPPRMPGGARLCARDSWVGGSARGRRNRRPLSRDALRGPCSQESGSRR